ncbi:DUF2846 domain-containing protein [Aquitalea sp.]|jgi:hypothetical protein|uniref:DUF2846 domain-containing protein n=1 Tax=Aquitalea sp. TaxID=1872623 RepID=UPI0025891166|nr:DUF2846 domain-containing protein [Aquitalea sp.]
MKKTIALSILLVLQLGGCASTPLADPAQDATRKQFVTKPDRAGLYIYRNESLGAGVHMDVSVDGKPLGQTVSHTYFYTELTPGHHTIRSEAENTSTLEFNAEAGRLYYIWQEVKMGILYARNKLHMVNDPEGQEGVRESRLAIQH